MTGSNAAIAEETSDFCKVKTRMRTVELCPMTTIPLAPSDNRSDLDRQ